MVTLPYLRKRRNIGLPITLSITLMGLNIALMVSWIVLLSQRSGWGSLTVGTVLFSLILLGLMFYLFLTIKEIRLNQRQANFIDSVTHELKSPIAAIQLYLETLQMRDLNEERCKEFYSIMESELQRLDRLISQLLQVGRLDALGQETEPEDIDMCALLDECALSTASAFKYSVDDVFELDVPRLEVHARRLLLEIIFRNLMENAIKYGGEPPKVKVSAVQQDRRYLRIAVCDNGEGVPEELRRKVFRIFFRRGSELERRRPGTGLGLFIVQTLVKKSGGRVMVRDNPDQSGSCFEVDLPRRRPS